MTRGILVPRPGIKPKPRDGTWRTAGEILFFFFSFLDLLFSLQKVQESLILHEVGCLDWGTEGGALCQA